MTKTKPRLLIVDDNPHDIELLRIAFEDAEMDAEVDSLSDGRKAIAELRRLAPLDRSQWPDCVVLDLNMPDTNGHEVLDYLWSEPRLRDLPVVVLTTSDAPSDRQRCLARGAREFLVKPKRFADFATIVEKLSTLLDHT